MKTPTRRQPGERGFALIVTVSLMILLTVIAVGLLSIGSISLRSGSAETAKARAYANARLAVLMAIGELQKSSGPDQRITADAAIYDDKTPAPQGRLVGVWKSIPPNYTTNPGLTRPPDYTKTKQFVNWLVSSPTPADLTAEKWRENAVASGSVKLFQTTRDGFDLAAASVRVPGGSLAWAVSQEGTKAKINVGGPDKPKDNVALQLQQRPNLALSSVLKQPTADFNKRAERVISSSQVALDTDLAGSTSPVFGSSYTVWSQGLLTDAARGGLKADMSLGFELSDTDFAKDSLNGVGNPFRVAGASKKMGFTASSTYFKGQQPLFRPLIDNPIISIQTDYDVATFTHRFYAAGIPTFDHLRSFYRIPYYLYGGNTSPIAADRASDHVGVLAISAEAVAPPSRPPKGRASTLAVRPVLNRVVYLLSTKLGDDDQVRLVITPVITLWNPYNTTIEIDGAVAYPWLDVPFNLSWDITTASGTQTYGASMSMLMGKQFEGQWHGRQVNPYFLCSLTGSGLKGNLTTPIRFAPGEIRVFVPTNQTPLEFQRSGDITVKTLEMRPLDNISQMTTKGGLSVPMRNGVQGHGFDKKLVKGDTAKVKITETNRDAGYHYFVTLEDSSRLKVPGEGTRGEAITEVEMMKFQSLVTEVSSPARTYDELKTAAQPFGVLETCERVAKTAVTGQGTADLLYTTNPRQPSMNSLLANGTFTSAPHFLSTLRSVASFDGAIQIDTDTKRAYWGASNNLPSGRSQISCFEIPREPLLSLAAFQHADLGPSTFSPSYQFANSWAPAYLSRTVAAAMKGTNVPIYDMTYLANESLWDGFFFSGAAAKLNISSSSRPSNPYGVAIASVQTSVADVIKQFVADPVGRPLSNSRMRLLKNGKQDQEIIDRLTDIGGCTRIAAYLSVDGAFNINSTDVEAWTAFLAGMRDQSFDSDTGSVSNGGETPFPRFRRPVGTKQDNWNGFRSLNDAQLRSLATNIVKQVKQRGPFLSLSEFVNRRVEATDLGKCGAIQAAIDASAINDSSKQTTFATTNYPTDARSNIVTDTGVGIPGYLSQADVLQSLAPVITPRSDTFVIRGYGEAKDNAGNVIARAWCEAVVQRMPEFVDPRDAAETALDTVRSANLYFGRRYNIISFRRLTADLS